MGAMNCPKCLGNSPGEPADACPDCGGPAPRTPKLLVWIACCAAAALVALAVGFVTRPEPLPPHGPPAPPEPPPAEARPEPYPKRPAFPPIPAPSTGEPIYERMLESADQSLGRARMLYEEGRDIRSARRLDDAAQAAMEARARYDVLAEAFDGVRRQTALDRLLQVNELARSIAASLHEVAEPAAVAASAPSSPPLGNPAPAPSHVPPSATARPPLPSPPTPPQGIVAFADYINRPALAAAGTARRLALEDAPRHAAFRPLLEAIAVFLETQTTAEPFYSSMERARMVELLAKYPGARFDAMPAEELQGAARDALTALKSLPSGERGELLRMWGLAHLARLAGLDSGAVLASRAAVEFGLAAETIGPQHLLGTREGLAIVRLKSAETFGELISASDRHPATAATMALRLERWGELPDAKSQMDAVGDLAKELKRWKPRDHEVALHAHLSKVLKGLEPCRNCKGSGNTDCPSCIEGLATFQCERCSGYGRILTNGARPLDCPDCKTRGRWQDKCPRCSAAGVRPCMRCGGKVWSAPALEDMVRFAPCGTCDGGGFLLAPFKVLCRECQGLGRRPYKP